MKILWIDHIYLDVHLYSTFPLFLIDRLRKNAHEVYLVVPSIKERKQAIAPLKNNVIYLPTVRLPVLSSLSFYVALFFYLPGAIKKISPDVIVADKFALPGAIAASLFRRIKLVMDIRGSPIGCLEKMQYIFSVALAKHICDCVTVTSSALKNELCDVFGVDPTVVKVLENGVALDLFNYNKYERVSQNLKKKLNLCGKFVVFYHGSFGFKRGLLETVEAIGKLVPKYPEIVFFILGFGTGDDKLESLIKVKSLEHNVYINKPVNHSQVPEFISTSDVGIAPLDTFSFPRTSCPLKILEYLAMERIVIATDIPFNRELLKLGRCMVLIPSNNPKIIAEAIEYVYKNRYFLRRMGKIGKAIIEQHFSWESKGKDLIAFIEALQK